MVPIVAICTLLIPGTLTGHVEISLSAGDHENGQCSGHIHGNLDIVIIIFVELIPRVAWYFFLQTLHSGNEEECVDIVELLVLVLVLAWW